MATAQRSNLTDILQGESYFGPVANIAGRQRWDFTLLFEQSILTIGPSALLLLVLPLRLLQLIRQRQKVSQSFHIFVKCGAYIAFGAFYIALLAQWAAAPGSSTLKRVSIAASTLGALDAIALGALSCVEHNRSVKPSTIISAYLLFSTVFDAVQCRTLWLLDTNSGLPAVFSAMLATKIFILAFELLGKQGILLETWSTLGPESTSGIISKAFFWWLNDFIIREISATLSLSSLWQTDQALQSSRLLLRIQHSRVRVKSTTKHALFWSVLHSLRWPLTECVFPRLCLIAFKFAQPFLIKRVITYVDTQRS